MGGGCTDNDGWKHQKVLVVVRTWRLEEVSLDLEFADLEVLGPRSYCCRSIGLTEQQDWIRPTVGGLLPCWRLETMH
jgi:hypothetical protein